MGDVLLRTPRINENGIIDKEEELASQDSCIYMASAKRFLARRS